MTRITALEDRIIAASQQASSMEAWLKREIHTCYATRREETGIALEMALTHLRRIQRTLEQEQ